MFKNSERFTIKGSTVNNVRGDQVNNTTLNIDTLHCNGEITTKRTEYDEFEYVKRGDVITLEEICSMDITEMKLGKGNRLRIRDRCRKSVYSVELADRQSKFTALVYEGEEAQDVWEEDFRRCSRKRNTNSCLLFALNHSDVPMLIFHHDLIPLAHLYTGSLWMNLYFEWLRIQLQCTTEQIWMDISKGVFCVGLSGPYLNPLVFGCGIDNTIIVPSTRDMLNANTIFSFFRQFNSRELHWAVITAASWLPKSQLCYHFLCHAATSPVLLDHLPYFFPDLPYEQLRSSLLELRFDIAYSASLDAVAKWPQEAIQWCWLMSGGVDQTSIGELTRFPLCSDDLHVAAFFDIISRRGRWLSQFPRCMEAGKRENYFVVEPILLELSPEGSREYDGLACFFKLCDGETPPPIYLFLYPPTPMTIAEVFSWAEGRTHFWSLDENGESEMTEDELEHWGVPRLALHAFYINLTSWPSSIYTALYDWQVAHGFDPTTTDFARHLGYPELEILRSKEEKSSSWWEAVPGSGISAFGF